MKKKVSQQTITFVFSDIEHSTRLAQKLHETYPEILERHRTVIRDAISRNGGREIDTAGDGFFMTFEHPQAAVKAAAEIQQEFHTQEWATGIGLKVRMGIHTGAALQTQSGYTGVEVHCASRICDAAYGGQVLISHSTQQYLEQEKIVNDLTLSDLGGFELKDFVYPIELFQLNIPGIERHFPSPRVDPDGKRIAVMPFANLIRDPEYEYLGEGMAEELIIALGKVKGLRVVSRSSSFAIKNEGLNAHQIGEKLHVNAVLEGRLIVKNGQIRISAELIDADNGFNIWSGQFDSAREQLVQIQDEITYQVSEGLGCTLVPEQRDSIQHRQTHNAEAYDYYLRGRRFYLMFSKRGIALAIQMFEKAIEADSTYALPYAGIADCYAYQYQHTDRSKQILEKADAASQKAIELGPSLAEAHAARGIVMTLSGKSEAAERCFQYATEIDPTFFIGWFHYARLCFTCGKFDKAARLFEQANRVEPEDYQSILLAAQSYDDISCPDLATTLRQRGVEIAGKWLGLNPGDTRALYLSANALVFLDQKEESLKLLKRALSLEPDDSMVLYNASCIYALLGMKTEALNCLERSHSAGLTLRGWYENDSNLDSLREEARFIKLLEKM
jgi:TolB-like protein/Tfp pilus assembly protein PilF